MTEQTITKSGAYLQQAINTISAFDEHKKTVIQEEKLHVPNVANALLFAYEQLRNASENIEDHLLLQRAIQRFYVRNLPFGNTKKSDGLAKELIIELTQAEYTQNDSVTLTTIKSIDLLIKEYLSQYKIFLKSTDEVTAKKWIFELLSVKTEHLINDPIKFLSFTHFAHAHFSEIIDYDKLIDEKEAIDTQDYPTLLYIAIHKALLKSDNANIRASLMELYPKATMTPDKLVDLNTKFDKIVTLTTTTNITKFVTKNGAALRILRSAFFDDEHSNPIQLTKQAQVDTVIETTIDQEYTRVRRAVNLGVIKSIIFLLLTKAIIGLVIEIPYDLVTTGAIVILPLAINLLFPATFIAVSAVTFRMPGNDNKDALKHYIQSMVYTKQRTVMPAPKYAQKAGGSYVFNSMYVATFMIAFYLIGLILFVLKFNIVQAVIFFIFFSTASFLGYRLTLQIKELELVTTNQGFMATLRDFFYTPFIFVGKKISYRFSQLNLVAQTLDIIIDLPLKTTVRLIRQWNVFLNNKKDELL